MEGLCCGDKSQQSPFFECSKIKRLKLIGDIYKIYLSKLFGEKGRKTIDKKNIILYYIGEIGNTGNEYAFCLVWKRAGVALFFYDYY